MLHSGDPGDHLRQVMDALVAHPLCIIICVPPSLAVRSDPELPEVSKDDVVGGCTVLRVDAVELCQERR